MYRESYNQGNRKKVSQETFLNTVIENKTVFGQGNGTISREDGRSSIDWNSYDTNLLKGGYPGYRGIYILILLRMIHLHFSIIL